MSAGKGAGELAADWMCPKKPEATPVQKGGDGDIDGVELDAGTAFFNNGATPVTVTTHMPDGSTRTNVVKPGETLVTTPPAKDEPPEDEPEQDDPDEPDDDADKPNPDDMPDPEGNGGGGPGSPWLRDFRPNPEDGGGTPNSSVLREGAVAITAPVLVHVLSVVVEESANGVVARIGS
jgi:hypothetical protein